MFRIVAARSLLLLSASSPAAAEGKRVALIIGMGEYQHLSSLTNPVPRRQGDRRGAAGSRLRGLRALQSRPRRSARCARDLQAPGARRRSGARLLCRPRHGGRRQERGGADRHGDRVREQDHAPLASSSMQLFAAAGAGAAADRAARRLPQQSLPAMPDARRGRGQRLSRLLAADRGGPLAADRQCDAVGQARGRRRCRRSFALRHSRCSRISTSIPTLYFARCARDDRARRARRLARERKCRRSPRGAARRKICLDATGCGGGGPALPPEARAERSGVDRRGARHLQAARLHRRCEPGRRRRRSKTRSSASRPRPGLTPGRADHADPACRVARDQDASRGPARHAEARRTRAGHRRRSARA